MRHGASGARWSRGKGLALCLSFVCSLVACGQSRGTPPAILDAGFDAPLPMDATGDGSPAFSVDFVVEGCSGGTFRGPPCRGQAPLALVFAPVVTGEFNRFFWDFGDGSPPSSLVTPAHVYEAPGRYDVGLVVGGPAGSLSRTHAGFVVVTTAGAGATCMRDAQCGAGLRCLCANAAEGCGSTFAQGICTQACTGTPNAPVDAGEGVDAGPGTDDCGGRAVCVNLGEGRSTPSAPWQTALCLASCRRNADCPAGLACRRLPGGPASTGDWPLACFPSVPRDIGAPCRDADGALDDNACTGGVCADLGAFGLCSADCREASCPAASHCAAFADGRHLCLPGCAVLTAEGGTDAAAASIKNGCGADPLLACVASHPEGPLGFSLVSDGGSEARVCGPRSCRTDSECAPAGRCLAPDAGEGACAWPRASAPVDAGFGRDEGAPSSPDATGLDAAPAPADGAEGGRPDAPSPGDVAAFDGAVTDGPATDGGVFDRPASDGGPVDGPTTDGAPASHVDGPIETTDAAASD